MDRIIFRLVLYNLIYLKVILFYYLRLTIDLLNVLMNFVDKYIKSSLIK
jgi:hypothetical protein